MAQSYLAVNYFLLINLGGACKLQLQGLATGSRLHSGNVKRNNKQA
jgi:hypothetical protein